MRFGIIIILAFILNACPFASDYFYLNRLDLEKETVTGLRLNSWNKVEQINQNSFVIRSGGVAAIAKEIIDRNEIYEEPSIYEKIFGTPSKSSVQKDFIFDFGVRSLNGQQLNISSRTSPTDYKLGNKGISIELFENTISVLENGNLIKETTYERTEEQTNRMIIINNGDYIKVSLDCDDIITWKTDKPISEYLIFESVGSGNWEINSVTVENYVPKEIFPNREYIK